MGIEFDSQTGLLLPGEYRLSLDNFEAIFVYNFRRREIFYGFKKLIDLLRQIECTHIYVDGSFVTQKPLPNDIDVCWWMYEEKSKRETQLTQLKALCPQLFFLENKNSRDFIRETFYADVFPANITESGSGLMFKDFFQRDKHTNQPKGIVIIDLL